jgi:hypothetical protein
MYVEKHIMLLGCLGYRLPTLSVHNGPTNENHHITIIQQSQGDLSFVVITELSFKSNLRELAL